MANLLSRQETGQKLTAVQESPTSRMEEQGLGEAGLLSPVAWRRLQSPQTMTCGGWIGVR